MNDKEYIEACWNEIEKNKTRNEEIYWGARHPKQQNKTYYNKRETYTKRKKHIFNKLIMTILIIEEILIILAVLELIGESRKELEMLVYTIVIILSIIKIVFIYRGRKKTEYINYNS